MRLDLLRDALWRIGLHDEVPFLEPSLRVMFRTRNISAHSIAYNTSTTKLILSSVKRGVREEITLEADRLYWAVRSAERCILQLDRIEGRIGDTDT